MLYGKAKTGYSLLLAKINAMQSPFPGMDPYLEGHLFPDVHSSLAYLITVQLTPQLPDAYIAQINNYSVEDTSPEEDIGIMYPDVGVFSHSDVVNEPAPLVAYGAAIAPETLVLPAIKPVEVRIPVVEIRDKKNKKLITAIEILSPVNKRIPGIKPYREKRERLHYAGVHMVEIDLIRRGERPLEHPYLPKSHYLVTVTRQENGKTQVWAIDVKESLPVIPAPLRHPDPDIAIDLDKALKDLYAQRRFEKSINYHENPPPPAFSKADREWMKELKLRN